MIFNDFSDILYNFKDILSTYFKMFGIILITEILKNEWIIFKILLL